MLISYTILRLVTGDFFRGTELAIREELQSILGNSYLYLIRQSSKVAFFRRLLNFDINLYYAIECKKDKCLTNKNAKWTYTFTTSTKLNNLILIDANFCSFLLFDAAEFRLNRPNSIIWLNTYTSPCCSSTYIYIYILALPSSPFRKKQVLNSWWKSLDG